MYQMKLQRLLLTDIKIKQQIFFIDGNNLSDPIWNTCSKTQQPEDLAVYSLSSSDSREGPISRVAL